ncbi:MAG: hypothetical protein AB7J35_18840 [Dehalococcoidia bacterium]
MPFSLGCPLDTVADMVTLTDVRDRLRKDLSDVAEERWPDDQLDRHIEHALSELSLSIPQELTATVATTLGSRDVSIATLDGLLDVEAVEFPVGEFPPSYAGYSVWGTTLALHVEHEPDGTDAKVFYTAEHSLDEEGSTLAGPMVDVLVTGASAFAAQELASGRTDALTTDPAAAERYAAWSRARLTAFRQLLHTYGRKNRVRTRRMFVPA